MASLQNGSLTQKTIRLFLPVQRDHFTSRALEAGCKHVEPSQNEMDVDAFLLSAEGRQGRWELRDGQPVAGDCATRVASRALRAG